MPWAWPYWPQALVNFLFSYTGRYRSVNEPIISCTRYKKGWGLTNSLRPGMWVTMWVTMCRPWWSGERQSGVHQCQEGMCLNVAAPLSRVPHCHHGQYQKPGPGRLKTQKNAWSCLMAHKRGLESPKCKSKDSFGILWVLSFHMSTKTRSFYADVTEKIAF